MTDQLYYEFFLDNQQTSNHQSFIFGLRELNDSEQLDYCSSGSNQMNQPPTTDTSVSFTANYKLRVFTSACYYLDDNQQWNGTGLVVREKKITNAISFSI